MRKITTRFTRWIRSGLLVAGFAVVAGLVAVSVGLGSLLLAGQERGNRSVADKEQDDSIAQVNEEVQALHVLDGGQETLTLKGHTGDVFCVAFSPDGKRLASASLDHTVKVWNATSGQEALTLKGHTAGVWSVAFSPDGKRLASASNDQTVKVWDATSGHETLTLKGHTALVMSVAFSPDGKRLASASLDKTVKLWDITPRP